MNLEAHRERTLRLAAPITALGALAQAVGAHLLAQRVRGEILEKLRAGRFHLVVVGEFNHGKSTFINALLGERVLPTGVTPTTACIHRLVHGAELGVTAVLRDGSTRAVPPGELGSWTAGEAGTEAVRHLEVRVPAPLLADGVVLIDTPGVNDLSLTRAEITYEVVPRSDAVLFVLDAGQPVKESERRFLEEQLLARSRDRIVFVLAKADLWSEAERAEGLSYVREALARLVPAPVVFAVSAEAALAGRAAESGLPELLAHLGRFLAEERGPLLLGHAEGDAAAACGVLRRVLQARRRASELGAAQLERRIELLRRALDGQAGTVEARRLAIAEEAGAIKAWARRDLAHFVEDLVARLPTALEQSSASDLRQHLGGFLERAFRSWVEAESAEIGQALERLAERTLALVADDAREAGERLAAEGGGELTPPTFEVDTLSWDLSVVAVLGLGLVTVFANALLGGALLAAAPALALWGKGRAEDEARRRALELAPAALREAADRVAPRLDELVDRFTRRLSDWVATAATEQHAEVLEVLEAVRRRRVGDGPADDEVREVDAALVQLAAIEASLAALARRGE